MGLDVHGVQDGNPFDFQHIIVTGGKEQMLAERDPEAGRMLQQVLSYSGYVQGAFTVSGQPGGQQQIMQKGQWREVSFVQDPVNRI